MKRKEFLKKGLASGAFIGSSMIVSGLNSNDSYQKQEGKSKNDTKVMGDPEEIVIERSVTGKPHSGKVLLAIQAHSDDIPLFAGGTVAKLMDEGYKGYLLRTSDDKSGDYEGNRAIMKKLQNFLEWKRHMIFYTRITRWMLFRFRISKQDLFSCSGSLRWIQ